MPSPFLATFHIPSPIPATHHLVFLPGNPGCIAYYEAYLAHLSTLLHSKPSGSGVALYGFSYANFSGESKGLIVSLQGQIEFAEREVERYVRGLKREDGDGPVRVILVGHSLGSWIGLEIIRRWREREVRGEEEGREEGQMRIVGYLGVWATVTGLARSPSGRKLAVSSRLVGLFAVDTRGQDYGGYVDPKAKSNANEFREQPLQHIPFLPHVASLVVHFLAALVPTILFFRLVQWVTTFPDDAASITANFLRSPLGVRQSLQMAGEELQAINEDRWSDDIWGAAAPSPGPPRTKLVFHFGGVDNWVSRELRDELIKLRGRGKGKEEEWRPLMSVDESEVPHSFCISEYTHILEG